MDKTMLLKPSERLFNKSANLLCGQRLRYKRMDGGILKHTRVLLGGGVFSWYEQHSRGIVVCHFNGVAMPACSCADACVRAWSGPRVPGCMRVCARALVCIVCMCMRILARMRACGSVSARAYKSCACYFIETTPADRRGPTL